MQDESPEGITGPAISLVAAPADAAPCGKPANPATGLPGVFRRLFQLL